MRRLSFRSLGGCAAAAALVLALGLPGSALAATVTMLDSSGNALSGEIDINDLEGKAFILSATGDWGEDQPQGVWSNLYDSSGSRVPGAFSFAGDYISAPENEHAFSIAFNPGVLKPGETYTFEIEYRTNNGTTIDTGTYSFTVGSSSDGGDNPPSSGDGGGTGGGSGSGDGSDIGDGSGSGGDADSGSGSGGSGSGDTGDGADSGSDGDSGSGSGGGSADGGGSSGGSTGDSGSGSGAGSGSGDSGAGDGGSGAGDGTDDGGNAPGEDNPDSDSGGDAGTPDDPAPSDPDDSADGDQSSNGGSDSGSSSGSNKDNAAKGDSNSTGSAHHKGDSKKDASVAAAATQGGGGNDGDTPSHSENTKPQGEDGNFRQRQEEQPTDGTVLSKLGEVYQLFKQPETTAKQQLQQLEPGFGVTGVPYMLLALIAVLLLACPAGLVARFAGYKRRLLGTTRLGTNAPAAAGAPNDLNSEPTHERHDA